MSESLKVVVLHLDFSRPSLGVQYIVKMNENLCQARLVVINRGRREQQMHFYSKITGTVINLFSNREGRK